MRTDFTLYNRIFSGLRHSDIDSIMIPSSSPIIDAFMRAGRDISAATNVAIAVSEDEVEFIELEDALPAMSKGQKRRLQQVSTKSDRVKVMEWMIDEANRCGDKHIPSKAIKNFPQLFRGAEKANLQKASRWWKKRDEFLLLFNAGGGQQRKSRCRPTKMDPDGSAFK